MSPDQIDAKYKAISNEVESFLLLRGFKHYKKSTLYRSHDDVVENISHYLRRVRGYNYGWVGVGAGVGYLSLVNFLRDAPTGLGLGNLDEKVPTSIGTSIGKLGPHPHFLEWQLLPETDESHLTREIITHLDQYAFPFLARFNSIEKALGVWMDDSQSPSYVGGNRDMLAAAGLYLSGRHQDAMSLMKERILILEDKLRQTNRKSYAQVIQERKSFVKYLETLRSASKSRQ